MTFILPSFGASAIAAVPGGGGFANDYSISLDGSDDYARLLGLTLSGAFTASFWFNPLSHTMTTGDLFMTKGYDANPYQSETDWKLDYANGGFRYSVYDRTQTWATKLEATHTFSFSANTWYHIMITYDGGTSTSGMALFVDGVSKTLTTATQNPSFTGNNSTSATAVNVGSSSQWAGGVLTGLIDEVAFWETDQSANISSIYNSGIPDDISSLSPVAWYRMGDSDTGVSNGSSTPTIVSNVGNSSAIQNHYALSYDGSDDYARATGLGLSGATSFSMWFNAQASVTTYPLMHMDANGLFIDIASGMLRCILYDNASGDGSQIYKVNGTLGGVSLDTWFHLAVTTNGTSTLKLYVNGVEKDAGNPLTGGLNFSSFNAPSSLPLDIGARTSTSTYAQQLIDEVAIFNSELSATNISDIYNSGAPTDISSLSPVAWWRMEEGSGTSVVNTANSGTYDATLVNGTAFSTNTLTANAILTNGPTYSDNVPT